MDIIVKVVLDQKEYERLLEIERKYNELSGSAHKQHKGAGNDICECQEGGGESLPLSQIIAENTAAQAVQRPLPGILPAITSVENEESEPKSEPKSENRLKHPNIVQAKRKKGKNEKKTLTFKSLTKEEKEELGFPSVVYPWYYIGSP